MKFFATVVLLALFAIAFAQSQPVEPEVEKKTVPVPAEDVPQSDATRDKRGLLLNTAYTAPIAYTAYSPYVYSAYHYPYTYSYHGYPYGYKTYY